jgi:DNA-binding response OmpR family regulator
MAVKVLIVEDNPVARSFPCRVGRESFSDTLTITSGRRKRRAGRSTSPVARRPARRDPFRLVLVDLELPDGNGMELLTELRSTGHQDHHAVL